jgi:hypothetical protein
LAGNKIDLMEDKECLEQLKAKKQRPVPYEQVLSPCTCYSITSVQAKQMATMLGASGCFYYSAKTREGIQFMYNYCFV